MLSIAVFLFFVLTNSNSFSMMSIFMRFRFREVFFLKDYRCASAERIWPPSAARGSVVVPNGEGVASGGATQIFKKLPKKFKKSWVSRQSPFARKALCNTGRAGPLACAAAADHLRP